MEDMFSTAKKYIEESAKSASASADQLLSQTRDIINNVNVHEKCHKCNAQISMLNLITNQNTCRMCCRMFCNACIAKSSIPVPNHLLDISFQSKSGVAPAERQYLCLQRCTPRVVNWCMQEFRQRITARFEDNVNIFMSEELKQHFFFPIPSESPEDTAYRKALRMIHIAGMVAGISGYAMTYNAVKYAYYSSELVNILTEGGILGILNPLMESLKECGLGITGPTALLRLYYLGCYHTLQAKVDTSQRGLLYEAEKPGVLFSECPLPVLEYVNSYLSAAQWMYMSVLPPPHQDTDWGAWYLSQIIRRQGWSVLMCVNDSTKLPDGRKCPAFALVTRCFRPPTEDGAEGTPPPPPIKEAMLVIRGSNSVMDWSINLEDEMCDYSFTHLVRKVDAYSSGKLSGSASGGSASGSEPAEVYYHCTNTVQGTLHKGLYTAAMGLLEGYNLRSVLMRLLSAGYQVKVVGHSLGAGIASLIAAEIRITLISKHLELYHDPHRFSPMSGVKAGTDDPVGVTSPPMEARSDTQASGHSAPAAAAAPSEVPTSPTSPGFTPLDIARPASGLRVPEYLPGRVASISAVVFSCPAFVTINLADAFLQDRLLINTVYDKDIIPRFSFKTIQLVAEELKDPDFCALADLWTAQDKSDFSAYAVSMGKAADIHKAGVAAAVATETAASETEEEGAGSVTDADLAATAEEAMARHHGATDSVKSDNQGIVLPTSVGPVVSQRPPLKPAKPAKPERSKTATSVESCASYATADGDSPLSTHSQHGSSVAEDGWSNTTLEHGPGSSSTLSTRNTGASVSGAESAPLRQPSLHGAAGSEPSPSSAATTVVAAAAAHAAAEDPGVPSISDVTASEPGAKPAHTSSMRSFMQGVSAFQTLAANVIDKIQNANDNFGASKQTQKNRPVLDSTAVPTAIAAPLPEDGPDSSDAPTDAKIKASSGSAAVGTVSAPPAEGYSGKGPAAAPAAGSGKGAMPAAGADAAAVVPVPVKPRVHTVTPGPIVHLYKENDGTVHAAVVTHAHSAFQRMQIIPAHSAEDHLMSAVRDGMRSALYQHQFAAPFADTYGSTAKRPRYGEALALSAPAQEGGAEVFATAESKAKFEKYFDIPVGGTYRYFPAAGTGPTLRPLSEAGSFPGSAQPLPASGGQSRPSVTAGRSGKYGNTPAGSVASPLKIHRSISETGMEAITSPICSRHGSSTGSAPAPGPAVEAPIAEPVAAPEPSVEAEGGAAGAKGSAALVRKPSGQTSAKLSQKLQQQWVPCNVCGLDVTWPYVLHSDASRAVVAHNCRKCGEVVCSLCSPAGDSLPGDGLNQSYQLSDYRVSLPECGLFAPQRVCLLCYFDT